jgi:hypothetical protein
LAEEQAQEWRREGELDEFRFDLGCFSGPRRRCRLLRRRGRHARAAHGTDRPRLSGICHRGHLGAPLTYVFVLSWSEWWQYVLGAGIVAALCLFFTAMLSRDAAAGREDQAMLKLARYLTLGQLVGMIVAMVGLVLDDKMPRNPDKPDWAASSIFFFGAASLAIISLNALRGTPSQPS